MKKLLKGLWSEYKYIIIAFLAGAGAMLTIYMCNRMIPFGDKTILRMDLYHQYGPLFAELYERITEGDSLFYSWTSGLGSSFLGNYFNYLSSPLGAIILFFGHKNMPEAIATMILLKAALASATFTYYSKRSLRSQSFATCAFGVLYAFSGYMLAYYWNVMWLDAMVLLPIVLLGIERIINNGKMKTYVIALALTIFSNYYISYMICIFSVIYFIYYYFANYSATGVVDRRIKNKKNIFNNRFIRSGIIFAAGSLAAAGLMACVLLPVYSVLKNCSATSDIFPTELTSAFNFFDFFANHIANLTTTIRSSGDDVLPNVYCGILTLLLAPLYFFTKSISKKEKLATLGLLTFLFFSFNLNILNFVWHGFHFPNDLPYRFSFIYSFILVLIAYKTFLRLKEFNSRQFAAVGAALVIFVMLIEELTSKNVTNGSVLLSLILIVLYVIILTIFKDKKYISASVAALLVVCVCSEAVMCDTNTVSITVDKEPFVSDYDDFTQVKETLDTIEEDEFYRMELTDLRTRMDNSWYYYNGASVFSSMTYEKLANLQDKLGMMSNTINSFTYNPQTPVYNMMFSLKYIVSNTTPDILSGSPNYESVYSFGKYSAYRNNYCLPIAYCVDENLQSWADELYLSNWVSNASSDPFTLQGDYFNLATGGMGSPFIRLEPAYIDYNNIVPFTEAIDYKNFYFDKMNDDLDGTVNFSLIPEADGNIYIYFFIPGAQSRSITAETPHGTVSHSADQSCILDLGYCNANDLVTVSLPIEAASGTLSFIAYTLDNEVMSAGYEQLKNQQVLIEEFEQTKIAGRFTAPEGTMLYTSIPYDSGWSVFIDGEKVNEEKIVRIADALIGVLVEEGNHDIEFRYEPSNLREGFTITIMTCLLIAAFYLTRILVRDSYKRKRKKPISYKEIDMSYSTKVFLDCNKPALLPRKKTLTEPMPQIIDISTTKHSDGPEREIITPPERKTAREVISPEKKEQ